MFYDPYLPNGVELALGIDRAASIEELLGQTDTLSIHTPLTPETRGLIGDAELSLLRPGAVVINDARGPILDLDALLAHLKSGHIAAAGLDVLPDGSSSRQAGRASARAVAPLSGARALARRPPRRHPPRRLADPESEADTRRKSAETMRAALLTNRPQNVITPEMY